MTAYVIVGFTPKDPEKLQQYAASAPPTLARHSGEIVTREPVESLHADAGYPIQVIVAFPSKEDATRWYRSRDYQVLIPVRDAGMDSQFQLIG